MTAGIAMLAPGRVATEADPFPSDLPLPRKSEAVARALAERGVHATTLRLPPSVHGLGDHGFVPILIGLARQTGVSAYLGDGLNRWSAVHRLDAGRLYRLVLEQGATEPAYHAVEHFGWFADFAGLDIAASSARTRSLLGWQPSGPDLLTDLDQPGYYMA